MRQINYFLIGLVCFGFSLPSHSAPPTPVPENLKIRISAFVKASLADALAKTSSRGGSALCISSSELDSLETQISAMEKEFLALRNLSKDRFTEQVLDFKVAMINKCCRLRGKVPPPLK